ncbi:hypothetical protein [Neptunicella marina]|uniref:Uncharacterized protein n=1 Tax=Neptunicella marina TaxID=2125989 RepID=A0A8J6J031_9ALTE|nr:hypothetical protein [Neptunicella marina]MBC3767533.1 hypothetical protein [Neptunicella marina]
MIRNSLKYLYLILILFLVIDSFEMTSRIQSWEYFTSLILSMLLGVFWGGWKLVSQLRAFPAICIVVIVAFSLIAGGVQMEYYFGSELRFYFFSVGFYLLVFSPFYLRIYFLFKQNTSNKL